MTAEEDRLANAPHRDEPTRDQADAAAQCLLAGFLPGLLAGTLLTGLLFFLNVDLPFQFGPVGRGVLLYGSVLGITTSLATFLFLPRDPRIAWKALPWMITGVLIVAAISSGFHASKYSMYLPPGINVRLIKAALWLSVGALVYFYTALLHTLHRRPYGPRSRIGLTLVAIAAVYVLGERRDAFEPPIDPTPLPSAIAVDSRPQLWVIGIEGATLDAILPLAEQGLLPTFARLLSEGAHARLRSFAPVDPIAHWTTLATGKLPYQHGVLSSTVHTADVLTRGATLELTPVGSAFSWRSFANELPVERSERESKTMWEILDRLGLITGTAGWPVSHPAPNGAAFGFSDRYFGGDSGAARPPEFAERGVMFRPTQIGLDAIVDDIFAGNDSTALRRALEADEWRFALLAFLSDQKREVDAHFALLPGLSAVSGQYFGGFDAVHFQGSTRERYQDAATVIVNYYQFLDSQIELLLSRAESSRIVVLVSPYGYSAPRRTRKIWSELMGQQLRGTIHGAPDGILVLAGDGLRADHFLESAELIDLVPTLLYGLGLPVARDLEGRVLTAAFEPSFLGRRPLTFVPSYETAGREGELQMLLESELGP